MARQRISFQNPSRRQLVEMSSILPVDGPIPARPGGARYGIVMRCGSRETWAVKQQPVDVLADEAQAAAEINHYLVLKAIAGYMTLGFKGVLMPCVYMRRKPSDRVEVGIAYFGGAHPDDGKRPNEPIQSRSEIEAVHGEGFKAMVAGFMGCLGDAAQETGVPLFETIDMDHRPRSALGTLIFSFLLHGRELYCLQIEPDRKSEVWEWLEAGGIEVVYSLPSVPWEVRDER